MVKYRRSMIVCNKHHRCSSQSLLLFFANLKNPTLGCVQEEERVAVIHDDDDDDDAVRRTRKKRSGQ
eukprot:scaffold14035_cov172-Amphora_coffeaeformis.AAC.10